jgi:hypothetical protein
VTLLRHEALKEAMERPVRERLVVTPILDEK